MPASPAVVPYTSLDTGPLKGQFKNFLYKSAMTQFGRPPSEIMYDFGDWMQHGPDLLIGMGFRGLAKSWVVVNFAGWTLFRDPQELVLNLAGSGSAASGNASLLWGMINKFDWLTHMKPRGIERRSALAFDVHGSRMEKSESFASLGILSGDKTGRRCGLALPDDIETPTTAASENDRKLLRQHWNEVGGAILLPGGKVRMLGTAQTEDTIYIEQATTKGYALRIWPVFYPAPEDMHHYGPWLAPKIARAVAANPLLAGTSTEPTRFTEGVIAAKRLEYGLSEFNRQFLLWTDVGGLETKPLTLKNLIVIEVPTPSQFSPLKLPTDMQWSPYPESRVQGLEVDSLTGDSYVYYPMATQAFKEYWQKADLVVCIIDPSGSGLDETAWGIGAEIAARVFLLAMGARLEGFTAATMEAIAKDCKTWGVNKVIIEKNFGGGMFGELLRPYLTKAGVMCSIEEVTATGNKEARIVDSLEALVTDHRLVFNVNVLRQDYHVSYPKVEDAKQRNYRLTYQFTRITKDKHALPHDDKVDMLAALAASFLGRLRRQLEEAAKDAKRDEYDKQTQEFIRMQREALGPDGQPRDKNDGWRIGRIVKDVGGMVGSRLFPGRRPRR